MIELENREHEFCLEIQRHEETRESQRHPRQISKFSWTLKRGSTTNAQRKRTEWDVVPDGTSEGTVSRFFPGLRPNGDTSMAGKIMNGQPWLPRGLIFVKEPSAWLSTKFNRWSTEHSRSKSYSIILEIRIFNILERWLF